MGCCSNGSNLWTALAVAGVVVAGAAIAVTSSQKNDSDDPADVANVNIASELPAQSDEQPEGQPDPMEYMQAWIDAGTPDEHHQLLEVFVGDWTAHSVSTMMPGQPPEESEGHEVNEMILGGRYLFTHHEGNFGDMPFEGSGVMGYDKIGKQWVSSWVDNFSTMIGNETGTYDKATRTWTMRSKMKDPLGNTVQHKAFHKIISDNERTMTFFQRMSDDEEWHQSMLITYTRN